jgi:hypothetical protein
MPKPTQIFYFGLVPKSPTHRGLIYVKKSALDLVMLGPFNLFQVYQSIRPPLTMGQRGLLLGVGDGGGGS